MRDFRSKYRFGLGLFEPRMEGTYLGILRKGVNRHVFVDPEILPGQGYFVHWTAEGADLDGFFSFQPE